MRGGRYHYGEQLPAGLAADGAQRDERLRDEEAGDGAGGEDERSFDHGASVLAETTTAEEQHAR